MGQFILFYNSLLSREKKCPQGPNLHAAASLGDSNVQDTEEKLSNLAMVVPIREEHLSWGCQWPHQQLCMALVSIFHYVMLRESWFRLITLHVESTNNT